MKIKLSFPANAELNRPELEMEALAIPRVGELVSLDNSPNLEVESVVHDFTEDGLHHKVTVNVEECGTKRRKLEGQASAAAARNNRSQK
jgi:hypothetical protein